LVNGRQDFSRRALRTGALALAALWTAVGAAPAQSGVGPVRLSDAAEQGAFNVGAARGSVARATDPVAGPVLKLDYSLPPGTAAGVWSKAFPGRLDAGHVDLVRSGVRADPAQAALVAVSLEIKGEAGTQRVPLSLGPDWAYSERPVDWHAVGTLKEVVLIVNRVGGGDADVTGSVDLDVSFDRISEGRKLAMTPVGRIAGVLLAGVLLALLRAAAGRQSPDGGGRAAGGPGRDFVLGAGVVLIACLAVAVNVLGARGPMEAGWACVGVAVAGAGVAWWLKLGLTGRHLTAFEVFCDVTATGLLAASTSALAILQAPASWSEVLLLSQFAAAAFVVLYHAANAYRLGSTGRHLGAAGGVLIVGTPYVVGGLVLLASPDLLRGLGGAFAGWALAARPDALVFVGRVLVIFGFNEVVADGLGLATKGGPLRTLRARVSLLAVAVAAVAAPWVAAYGSGARVASWPVAARWVATVLTTMLSQGGLWAEVYLITGLVMDAVHGLAPSRASVHEHPVLGLKKGMVYSGVFMGILHGLGALWESSSVRAFAEGYPVAAAALFGALVFPMVKTIIETFDGSQAFFRRVGKSYRRPTLYARGAVVGLGLGCAYALAVAGRAMGERVGFGFVVGLAAFAGVNLIRDALEGARGRGRVGSWRVYFVQALLGGCIGAAFGFYLDAAQVGVVVAKYHSYLVAGGTPERVDVYPLLSKWGFIDLGTITGGVSLLFAEALKGVISWAIPSWLFAINRTFMAAYFRKEAGPIKALFTREGMADLTLSMIGVLRWGLWMSPIINSFLRPTGVPTWYDQDGAVRTVVATYQDLTLGPDAFRAWSLQIFIYLLAYDWVRILIWLDHFGLRVATLVNLSFLGMDRLDERLSRFLGPAATARCIPEAVKRFTTWAPLLLPFYIPRGKDWDVAWSESQAIQNAHPGGMIQALVGLPVPEQGLILMGAVVACTAGFSAARRLRGRGGSHAPAAWTLANPEYEVTLRDDGAVTSRVPDRNYDLSRRSYDLLDPAGRAVFLVDASGEAPRARPVVGNAPGAEASQFGKGEDALRVVSTGDGLRTTVEISLPGAGDPAELWTVTVENLTDAARRVKVVPYLEWVLNRPDADRGHTQYNRLFAEIEYAGALHAVLAWDKHAQAQGFLASDVAPDGFLSARVDFLGRARSLWNPRALETLAFSEARDTEAHPTFDPIGSLLVSLDVPARGSSRVRFLMGLTRDKGAAIDLIARHLQIPGSGGVAASRARKEFHPIRHGEVPPGTPRPYSEFSGDGRTLHVRTPFTTRPYDHTMSNALGHVVAVTNRGLHTTSSVNAQQNRLTPDWSDTVTREVPAEAFYLYEPETREWYSPTYQPLNDPAAEIGVEFGVDGTAVYRMSKGTVETELTVFVPPDEPVGVYILTVRNLAEVPRRLRLAPYFQMVLAGQPEDSGPLTIQGSAELNALFFENPRNTFRTGPAFVAVSGAAEHCETVRGRFFGGGRGVAHPYLVEHVEPDAANSRDDRPVAAFLTTLEIPAREERIVVVVLGQADDRGRAERVIRIYRDPALALVSLETTRQWWLALMETLTVKTDSPEFDRYLDWLKYQALAERIWARRGFYQASGAFGFRDQLQDSVNLVWVDPAVARKQILLHASQQFVEGDVVHWFHLLQDGRTGFVGRTHASDNLLWLAWGVVEYVGATGDASILGERTAYLESEQPFEPLPAGKAGAGFDPLRSARVDTVYRHCLKAIDLVLEKRMGVHGLPLMGTGDWNDGLDEIGSQGRGESVWLGLFLSYILERMAGLVETIDGPDRQAYYLGRLRDLKEAIERTWRGDRYLRAFHDDGTEIGVKGSGVWEIDALTAAWAVMSGVNPERGRVVFDTAVGVLERETTILLGWPPLREDTHPYLGRSSAYPAGVRENGMYCHGDQWLVGAARVLADRFERDGRPDEALHYRETAYRLWLKISPIPHVEPDQIEIYGGQPNKQAADMVTTFDPGRMIWHGYTGAAGWMLRQALEGVLGLRLVGGEVIVPNVTGPPGGPALAGVSRDLTGSPLQTPTGPRPTPRHREPDLTSTDTPNARTR